MSNAWSPLQPLGWTCSNKRSALKTASPNSCHGVGRRLSLGLSITVVAQYVKGLL